MAHGSCAATSEIQPRRPQPAVPLRLHAAEHLALLPPDAAIIELPPRMDGEGSASPAADLEVVLRCAPRVAGAAGPRALRPVR